MKTQLFTKTTILRSLLSLFFLLAGVSGAWGADMIVDFESATSSYADWTFTNMISEQTAITAHGGSMHGTTGGKASASIATKNKVANPQSISFYVSKSTNNATSSNWIVQVSSNGTSWTDVKSQSASSMTKGSWVEVSQNLTAYSNVYVRVLYSGTTAVRCIDDLKLTTSSNTMSAVAFSDVSLDFGIVQQNQEVAAKTITATLSNVTSASITLSGSGASAFSVDKTNLTKSEEVTITPNTSEAGKYEATLTLSATGVTSVTKEIRMIVEAPFLGSTMTMNAGDDANIKFVTGSSSATGAIWANSTPLTYDGISLSGSVTSGNNYSYYDGSVVRFYTNNNLVITPAAGVSIVKVEIERQSTTGNNTGTINCTGLEASKENTTTNTNVFIGSATSAVTFNASAQARFNSIKVFYYPSDPKKLLNIAVSGNPAEFWKGDDFNHDDMTVTATWDDESTSDVTSEAEFSAPEMSTAGQKTVTVMYQGKTATYTIDVKTIENSYDNPYTVTQAKALIDAGKDLTTGVYVKGIVSQIITPWSEQYSNITYSISDDGLTTSQQFQLYRCTTNGAEVGDIVVGYGNLAKYNEIYEFAAENYLIDIQKPVQRTLTSITVSGTPTKTSYYAGDAFDPAGLVVTGHFSDGSEGTITEGIEWSIDPETLTLGTTSVEVIASVGSVVSEVYTVNGLTVAENPYKTEIYTFTEFISARSVELTDLDGFTIKLVKGESSSSNPAWSSSQARVYAGGSLTVKANNAVIKSIAFNYVVNANNKGVSPTIDGVEGTTSAGVWDAELKTWTGDDEEVTFSTSGSAGNVGFTSLVITYKQGSKTKSSLEWSSASAVVTMGANDNEFPTLSTTPGNLEGITYESSNVAVATISADGTITLVVPGETTITARYAGNDDYTAASASYVLTVNKAPHILTPAPDGFEAVHLASLYSSVTTNATVEDYEGASFDLSFAKPDGSSNPTKYYNSGRAVRAYVGNTITITAAENIMAVVVGYVSGYADDAQTITGLGTTTAVITFSKTCRFTSITVYYRGYTRSMSIAEGQTKWGTICLPDSVPAATVKGAEFYSILGVTKDGQEVSGIVLEKVETGLVAGVPYLFKATGDLFCAHIGDLVSEPAYAPGLVGSFEECDVPQGCYVLSNNQIRLVNGGVAKIGPNRAYLDLSGVEEYSGSAANALRFGFDGEVEDYTTYIQMIQYDAKTEIFDLLGNKVQTMKKGQLYIVNGKKMFNK